MPRPYSADLRERVLRACERSDGRQAGVARRLKVCEATVSNWRRQVREDDRRCARAGLGGRPALAGALDALGRVAAAHRDATLAEYAALREGWTGRRFSLPAICRALRRLGWASEQDRADVAERQAWRADLTGLNPADLVFIDDAGINARMTRTHARAPKGQRAGGSVPCGQWKRLTLLGAFALDGAWRQ